MTRRTYPILKINLNLNCLWYVALSLRSNCEVVTRLQAPADGTTENILEPFVCPPSPVVDAQNMQARNMDDPKGWLRLLSIIVRRALFYCAEAGS